MEYCCASLRRNCTVVTVADTYCCMVADYEALSTKQGRDQRRHTIARMGRKMHWGRFEL